MSQSTEKPLALIVGVGGATGQAVCHELAPSYRLAMVARSNKIIDSIANDLEQASAYPCDVTDQAAWTSTLNSITSELGVPDFILVNTEGGGWGDYLEISIEDFSTSFNVNVVSILVMIQTLFPDKQAQPTDQGNHRVIINSSPAAYVSHPLFLGIAPSRAGQRVLAETLDTAMPNVDFGILSIDGAIDEPNMRNAYPKNSEDFFIKPAAIAAQIKHMFQAETLDRTSRITSVGNSGGIDVS